MECVISVKAIKYIYKYVYKGHDRTTMEFGKSQDEIKLYLDAHYVSACEGFWHITQSIMHQKLPHIVCLQVHLEGQHLVSWKENDEAPLQAIINQAGSKDTTLMGYFKANAKYPAAYELLYQDMPLKFTWNKAKRIWSPRKDKCFCLGRMYYAHPNISFSTFFSLLSRVPPHLNICVLWMMWSMAHSKRLALPEVFWRMKGSGSSVLKKPVLCRQDLKSALCSSPFS
jgi:hypothetical protein